MPTQNKWPDGETMSVPCPQCGSIRDTQIETVREDDLPERPEDCFACNAEFMVSPDGRTELVRATGTGTPEQRAAIVKKFPCVFDPR